MMKSALSPDPYQRVTEQLRELGQEVADLNIQLATRTSARQCGTSATPEKLSEAITANGALAGSTIIRGSSDGTNTSEAVVPKTPIKVQGVSDFVLVASCFGDLDSGGGLFQFDGQRLERIDRLSSTGLFAASGRFVRLLRSAVDSAPGSELLVYDGQGVHQYLRIDSVADAHDVLWDGSAFVIASTMTNSIAWVSPGGQIVRTWRAPGRGDAWHLNCVLEDDGELYVSAFGRFRTHREWEGYKDEPTGVVFRLATGEDILHGLSMPHSPRLVDGSWVVCNSRKMEIVEFQRGSADPRRKLALGGYTRGLAVSDDYLYVGESASRGNIRPDILASIAVVCRKTWKLIDRLALPCREVYDLTLVPRYLAQGIRQGFRTNPRRTAEQEQYHLFDSAGIQPVRLWASGDPLPPQACRAKICAALPSEMAASEITEIECKIENLGGALLSSLPPYPVHLSYKWIDPKTGLRIEGAEGHRTSLCTLPPRIPTIFRLCLQAPPGVGEHLLRLTLVQEDIGWFDEMDAKNACQGLVRVKAA
jgi:acetolactate synthase-1/2/3 large subunit